MSRKSQYRPFWLAKNGSGLADPSPQRAKSHDIPDHLAAPGIGEAGPRYTGGIQSLSLAAVLMMVGLLLSKVTGQLREILIVPVLGYGTVSDAFVIGFQIPDLFYQLLIGGAIQAAITPTLAAALEKRQLGQGWRSVSIFMNFAALAMLVAVLAGEFLAPLIIPLYNAGKDPAITPIAINVARALFPQTFFMMLAALCIGILNAYRKFLHTAFGPAVYNVFVIMAMVLLGQASPTGAVRVASGVMLAACLYFLMQFGLARKEFGHYTLAFDYRDSGFRRLFGLALPTMLSGSIVQINMIILTSFANQFPGAATSLRQASTTWQLPYGIFAVAIGNVMLPALAGLNAKRDYSGSRKILTGSLRSALFLTIPAAALFLAMQQDTIRAIFQWGAGYSEQTVGNTAVILRWYCLAIVLQTFIFIINQAFYAQHQTRVALANGVATLILNGLICLALTRWTSVGVGSLSLAYLLTSGFSAILLYTLYKRFYPAAAPRRIWPFLLRASLGAGSLLLVVLAMNALPIRPDGKIGQLLWYFCRFLFGFAAFLAVARLLRMPEARKTLTRLGSVWRRIVSFAAMPNRWFRRKDKPVPAAAVWPRTEQPTDLLTGRGLAETVAEGLGEEAAATGHKAIHRGGRRGETQSGIATAWRRLAVWIRLILAGIGHLAARLWRKIREWFSDRDFLD
jgi:putative peptidoglycan lipid II flippase